MKKLIVLALALVSASVFAYPVAESVSVHFGSTTVQLHKTCLNADGDLQTLVKVKKYQYIAPRDMYVLISDDYLTTPVSYTVTTCKLFNHIGECLEQASYEKSYPLSGNIMTYDYMKINKDQEIKKLIGITEFSVPACE